MVDTTLKIKISDGGTLKPLVAGSETFKNNMHAGAAALSKGRMPGAAPRAASAPTGGGMGGGGSGMGQELTSYGIARGAVGTGAAGRDFAQQAQGLGGIVHLYATFAANLFAVGAAFRALSNAMDTTNLVKGLDQLGAASGTSLGSLSKNLIAVTDGAISMRQAMESTAKASSSGMSSENILRMGKLAKQASQALGVDMADGVSRLTRGITKLEPELLDELGIFTKVGKATEDYAKSVGKSTAAITDFEKRQAYANAVLKEGEDKFKAIDFETNPYTKLLAGLKDVAQVGLEFVNRVLGPFMKMMSESPTALGLAIAAIGATLVKQAIPALGQFKEGMARTSAIATAQAKRTADDAILAENKVNQIRLANRDSFANRQLANLEAAQERLAQAGVKAGTKTAKLLDTNFAALNTQETEAVNKQIENIKRKARSMETAANNKQQKGGSADEVSIIREKADAMRYGADAAKASLTAEEQYTKQAVENSKQNWIAKQKSIIAAKAETAAQKQQIVSNAAYNGGLVGVRGSLELMNAELELSPIKLSKFDKGILNLRVGFTALAGTIGTALKAMGGILNIIAMVGAFAALINSIFSKNAKEMTAFDSAVDSASESVLNLSRTLDTIDNKAFGEQLNTESLSAKANAISEITSAVGQLTKSLTATDKAASDFDWFIDGIKKVWGGDLRSVFSRNMTTAIFDNLKKLGNSPEIDKTRKEISSILEIDPEASRDSWKDAFASIAQNETKLALITERMKDLGTATAQTADDAKQFDLAIKKSSEALKNFIDQFKIKDPLALLAETLVASGVALSTALKEPENAIGRLAKIAENTSELQLFGDKDQITMMNYKEEILSLNKEYEQNKKVVSGLEAEYKQLNAEAKLFASYDDGSTNPFADAAWKAASEKGISLRAAQELLAETLSDITTITGKFPNLAAAQLSKGADYLSASISVAISKASDSFKDAVLNAAGDLPGIAKERAAMELRKLASEEVLISIQKQLLLAFNANTAAITLKSAQDALGVVDSDVKQSKLAGIGPSEELFKRQREAAKAVQDAQDNIGIINIAAQTNGSLKAIKLVQDAALNGNKLVASNSVALLGYINSISGLNIQQQSNNDKKRTVLFKEKLATLAEEYAQIRRGNDLEKASNKDEKDSLEILKTRNSFLNEAQSLKLQDAKIESETLASRDKQLKIAEKFNTLEAAKGGLDPAVYAAERTNLAQQQINEATELGNKILGIRLVTVGEISAESKRQLSLQEELNATYKKGTDATRDAALKALEIEGQTAKTTGKFSPEYQAKLDYELGAFRLNEQAKKDVEVEALQYSITINKLAEDAKALIAKGASDEAINEIRNKITAEASAVSSKIAGIVSVRDTELEALRQVEQVRKETSNFDSMINGVKALDSVFQGLGTTLSDIATIFRDSDKSQKQYLAGIEDLTKKQELASDPTVYAEYEDQKNKLRKESAKDEITSYAKLAGASKKLFSEKTAAYKVLNSVEKVMHITRLAMDAKELGMKLSNLIIGTTAKAGAEVTDTGITFAGTIARLPAYAAEIFGKITSQIGLPGPVVAGGMIAAMFALFGKGGGGGSSTPSFAMNSEQRQETQGTGTTYDSTGSKVEVAGGVFGSSADKVDSINKSLEIIKDNSVDGLSYDNKMLKALQGLASALTGAAKAIYAIPGLRQGGTGFGTLEGTSSSAGFGGSIPIIGGILSSIFGGGTTANTTIESAGIQLRGSFQQVMDDTAGSIVQYKDLLTNFHKKGGWFSSSRSWSERRRETQDLNKDVTTAIADVFTQTKAMFTDMGAQAGVSAEQVNTVFRNMSANVDIDLKGLTGDAIVAELNAVIGSKLNQAAFALFSDFEQYKKFGEGYLETVTRVVDTSIKIQQVLTNMGINSVVTNVYQITEAMADAAGGIEAFVEQYDYFKSNFLTEAQQVVPLQKAVTEEMARLGVSSVDTRKEFVQLVQGLDVTSAQGRDMYAALMNVQEGFDLVAKAAERLQNSTEDLLSKAYNLLGNSDAALALTRARELEGTDERLKSLQEYVYALEDVNKAQDAMKNIYKDQISTLDSFVKSADDYINSLLKLKDSLALGVQSVLTPGAKYSEAGSQFSSALAGANKAIDFNASPEEVARQTKEKTDAISAVQSLASTFLDSSKVYNASSSQYTSDYSYVQAALSSTASTLEAQKFSAMTALDYAKAQSDALNNVNQSTTDTNTIISNLKAAWDAAEAARAVWQLDSLNYTEGQKAAAADIVSSVNAANAAIVSAITGEAIPTFATGGLASRGFAIVGEQGPELVNFQNPGMVYTAEQTLGMFNGSSSSNSNAQMVNELRALRQEVAALRQQQTTETGHLINATYEAQSQNADAVSQAVLENGKKQIWDAKVKQTVKLA